MAPFASVTCRSSTGPVPDKPAPFALPPPHQTGPRRYYGRCSRSTATVSASMLTLRGRPPLVVLSARRPRTTAVDPPKVMSAASRSTACRRRLSGCAAGRPFAWVDDEITDAGRDVISSSEPQHLGWRQVARAPLPVSPNTSSTSIARLSGRSASPHHAFGFFVDEYGGSVQDRDRGVPR